MSRRAWRKPTAVILRLTKKSLSFSPNTAQSERRAVRILWTKRYRQELQAIGDYIEQHSQRAAARVVNTIHSRAEQLLSANPFIGRTGEIEGTRELVITGTPYIVAYRVADTRIEVLFVQHGARPVAERCVAREAFAQALHLHRSAGTLHKELKAAEMALATEPTDANYRHLVAIQTQFRDVQATEALIEGFGVSSGRAAINF